jgi:MoxR-like ATPase
MDEASISQFKTDFLRVRAEINKVIVGHTDIIDGVLICLLAGGHVLLEGVPGLGKTLLVRTLSQALDLSFNRVQFTPDLMPADITGTNILMEDAAGRKVFQFQPGPVFANIVLADEINRATPKTQSAMLEAMQEHSVTVAGKMYKLQEPFFVLATQNPIEMEGTYPLPEAQMDRFLFKLIVPSPSLADLTAILDRTTGSDVPQIGRVLDGSRLLAMRAIARDVPVATHVRDYAAKIILATHPKSELAPNITNQFVRFGSSPRGGQALILAAKIRALLDGRYNVAYDDISSVAPAALRHRVLLNFEGEAEGIGTESIVREIVTKLSAQAAQVSIK